MIKKEVVMPLRVATEDGVVAYTSTCTAVTDLKEGLFTFYFDKVDFKAPKDGRYVTQVKFKDFGWTDIGYKTSYCSKGDQLTLVGNSPPCSCCGK